jgi:hypothetical protein
MASMLVWLDHLLKRLLISFLHLVGADAVGMSTASYRRPACRHPCVASLESVTKPIWMAIPLLRGDVLEAGKKLVPKLTSLIRGVLRRL